MTIETEIDQIESFNNINSVIQYFHKSGVLPEFFVDSSDVLKMLGGLDSMRGNQFQLDTHLYDSESTLIYSLIYGNWLGSIHLLVPHQEELLKNLTDMSNLHNVDDIVTEFWGTVVQDKLGLTLADLENGAIETNLQKLAPVAGDLGKANYLLCEITWRERFRKLINEQILILDRKKDDLVELVNTDLFKTLHRGFKQRRPKDNSKRNLSDTMVLCILQKRIQDFKDEKTKKLPLFIDSFFDEIVEMTNTSEYFTVYLNESEVGSDKLKPFNVLIKNQFVKYYALNKNLESIELSLQDINDKSLLSEYKQLSSGISRQAGKVLKKYSEAIEKFTQSRFLQVCWVNSKAKIAEMLLRMENVPKLRSKIYQETLNEDVNQLMTTLNGSTAGWAIFKDIFDAISNSNKQINEIFNTNLNNLHSRGHKFDVMSELSLIRFSVEEQYIQKANNIIHTLLFPGNQSTGFVIKNVADEVLSALYNKRGSSKSVIVPVLVLWVIEEYHLIDRIFTTLGRSYPHYSEAFVHASAIAKVGNDTTDKARILTIMSEVDDVEKWKFEKNYKTAIAASYVYFHLWFKRYPKHFFATLSEPKASNISEVNKLYDKALEYANLAISWLENANFENEDDQYMRAKYYYMLNCRIYYITLGAENKRFFQLKSDVGILQDSETTHAEIWEYRYYDTLALYHLRRAVNACEMKNLSAYNLNIEQAKEEIQKGLALVISKEDQTSFNRLSIKIQDQTYE